MRERQRVLVTGGAGLIGHRLCTRLLARGAQVVCVDDLSTGSEANLTDLCDDDGFTLIRHDVVDPLPALGAVDLVFHLACPPSPEYYLGRPVHTIRCASEGTRNTLEVARRSGARYVLASTSEVYGDPAQHPQVESYWGNVNSVGPRSVYDEGKRYAEALTMAYAREYGTDTSIARIFNTYGPGMRVDDGRVVPAFIDAALDGRPLTVFGDGTQTRSLCYVDDTVDGLMALGDSSWRDPVNIGNPHEMTVLDLAEIIVDATGGSMSVEHHPARVDDPVRRCPDIGVARRELKWTPRVSAEEGLRRTVSWFVGNRRHPVAAARAVADHAV
ncbi:UDP-glucuronic acid decarboxylase family protein [Gordonia sp. DT219]|uniref:UDP-glucuronic acid decarboxylase family protein n=1 Tax=Gordonia sp. DT219 TaxID=3416658 RepID=UPI003CF9980E